MSQHVVAIFGGAVSGAETANQLLQKGIHCVVFEQNALPYGKIEDGLPKWHAKLRDKEETNINTVMSNPLVTYVPDTKLGSDISFEEIKNMGFTAIILATGAWKDRPLPIEGIDEYVDKGLYYQNPFVYWFNHFHEPAFAGKQFEIVDDAIVIGGGLASLDVCKILMMEQVVRKLKARGINTNCIELEHGIPKFLEKQGLKFEDLGIKGCTLFYRRREMDMPLAPVPTETPEQLLKAQNTRQKILNNYMTKYLFRFSGCMAPADKIIENGKLTGIRFRKTEIIGDQCNEIAGTETDVFAPLVISSIGSIPELLPGVPSKGTVFKLADETSCRIQDHENVFAVGNAVTGRGNINESSKHAEKISGWLLENFLNAQPELSEEKQLQIFSGIKELQQRAGYNNNYMEWMQQHLPKRIEHLEPTGAH